MLESDELHSCPWCGALVPEADDCPRPSVHCDHSAPLLFASDPAVHAALCRALRQDPDEIPF